MDKMTKDYHAGDLNFHNCSQNFIMMIIDYKSHYSARFNAEELKDIIDKLSAIYNEIKLPQLPKGV